VCVNTSTCESFLLSSAWLQAALNLVARTLTGTGSEADLIHDSASHTVPLRTPQTSATGPTRLSAVVAVHDPFAGHIVLLRMASKEFQAVNVTMHVKLSQMQNAARLMDQASERVSLKEQFRSLTGDDSLRFRHAQKLIAKIATGLKEMPELEVTVQSASDTVGPQVLITH
jgi:hypothetical protein